MWIIIHMKKRQSLKISGKYIIDNVEVQVIILECSFYQIQKRKTISRG